MSIIINLKYNESQLKYLYKEASRFKKLSNNDQFKIISDHISTIDPFTNNNGYYMYWTDSFIQCSIINQWCLQSGFESIMLFDIDNSEPIDNPYCIITNWNNIKNA